jgi:methionyl-tRNA formyltransferase
VVGLFHRPAAIRAAAAIGSADKQLERLRRQHRIPEIRCDDSRSSCFIKRLESLHPHCVLVGNWADQLSRQVLAMPDITFVNCHPSLLPTHRGPNPYASVLRQGEPETGVTFHYIAPAFDSGPVLLQRRLPVYPQDTGASLRVRCTELAGRMVPEVLQALAERQVPVAQAELGQASYFPAPREENGLIDWHNHAQVIYNTIRSLNPWFYSYSFIDTPLGRLRLLSKSAALRQHPADGIAPGTILTIERRSVWVATASPNQVIGLRDVRIEGFNWLRSWALKPGKQLYRDPA